MSNIQKFGKPHSDQPQTMYFRFSCPWNEVSPFRAKYFSIKASKIGNIFGCNLQPEVLHFVHVFLANEPPQHFHLCKLLPRFDRWLAWKFSLPLFYFLLSPLLLFFTIFTWANFCPGLIAGWHKHFHFHSFNVLLSLFTFIFHSFHLCKLCPGLIAGWHENFHFHLFYLLLSLLLLFFTIFTCANFAQVWSRAGMKIRKGAISWQCPRCSRNEMPKSKKLAALLSRESVETF